MPLVEEPRRWVHGVHGNYDSTCFLIALPVAHDRGIVVRDDKMRSAQLNMSPVVLPRAHKKPARHVNCKEGDE